MGVLGGRCGRLVGRELSQDLGIHWVGEVERLAAPAGGELQREPRRAFDGERRERRFDGDKPRRAFDGERRERRFDGDKPRRSEGQLWPNDRFRYRDEAGRERLRSKRPTRLQRFSADEED